MASYDERSAYERMVTGEYKRWRDAPLIAFAGLTGALVSLVPPVLQSPETASDWMRGLVAYQACAFLVAGIVALAISAVSMRSLSAGWPATAYLASCVVSFLAAYMHHVACAPLAMLAFLCVSFVGQRRGGAED